MILGIVQARMSSSRLPGKVMLPILDEPMLVRQMERMLQSKKIDQLLIATSTNPSDDIIEDLCRKKNYLYFRGNLTDVLDRFYHAALLHSPDHIVRLTADCPLIDPEIIDRVVEYHLDGGFDYTSNCLAPTFPDGLDVEVFTFHSLQEAWLEADLQSEREHVTLFIHKRPQRYRLGNYSYSEDLSHLRWTVDEPADYELVKLIYEHTCPNFNMNDVLSLLAYSPDWLNINSTYKRNEGLLKSLMHDNKLKE